MDSMDWFEPTDPQPESQVQTLYRALKVGGKVLLRSAGLTPWYMTLFEKNGFGIRRVGTRYPGSCIDRYRNFLFCIWNVYANRYHNAESTCMLRPGYAPNRMTPVTRWLSG